MKPIKKIEIVADAVEVKEIVQLLEKFQIKGYTLIKGVAGKGLRGEKNDDGLTGVFQNSYLMVACSEKEANELIEEIRPLLKNVGGICLVSDAQWVIH